MAKSNLQTALDAITTAAIQQVSNKFTMMDLLTAHGAREKDGTFKVSKDAELAYRRGYIAGYLLRNVASIKTEAAALKAADKCEATEGKNRTDIQKKAYNAAKSSLWGFMKALGAPRANAKRGKSPKAGKQAPAETPKADVIPVLTVDDWRDWAIAEASRVSLILEKSKELPEGFRKDLIVIQKALNKYKV